MSQVTCGRGRDTHPVNSIGPVLGFQAESRVLGVRGSPFTLQGAIQVVPGVKLDARLGGVNLHGPAGGRVENPAEMPAEDEVGLAEWARPGSRGGDSCQGPSLPGHKASILPLVQAEVVVEAIQVKLLQVLAQLHRLPEIESSALHSSHLP